MSNIHTVGIVLLIFIPSFIIFIWKIVDHLSIVKDSSKERDSIIKQMNKFIKDMEDQRLELENAFKREDPEDDHL